MIILDFTYRVSIENFGENVSNVRLFDRLPQAKEADIKLSLVSTGEDLSDDPTYRKGDHSKGILRWEVEVPARAVGHQAKQIEYKFQLEYDKQMNLAGMPVAAR